MRLHDETDTVRGTVQCQQENMDMVKLLFN